MSHCLTHHPYETAWLKLFLVHSAPLPLPSPHCIHCDTHTHTHARTQDRGRHATHTHAHARSSAETGLVTLQWRNRKTPTLTVGLCATGPSTSSATMQDLGRHSTAPARKQGRQQGRGLNPVTRNACTVRYAGHLFPASFPSFPQLFPISFLTLSRCSAVESSVLHWGSLGTAQSGIL